MIQRRCSAQLQEVRLVVGLSEQRISTFFDEWMTQ